MPGGGPDGAASGTRRRGKILPSLGRHLSIARRVRTKPGPRRGVDPTGDLRWRGCEAACPQILFWKATRQGGPEFVSNRIHVMSHRDGLTGMPIAINELIVRLQHELLPIERDRAVGMHA